MEAIDRVREALTSSNSDQRRIARVGLDWLELLLKKNSDYGGTVWLPPALKQSMNVSDAILVRMSDKIGRLANLLDDRQPAEAEISDESIEDTMRDLGAYTLLWLARPKGEVRDS